MDEVYRVRKIRIRKSHYLFNYCDNVSACANNLSNAVRFRQRQVLTASSKDESAWTDNEKEIMDEIKSSLHLMGKKYEMPDGTKKTMSYQFLDALLVATRNPDYYAEDFSSHTAQMIIKQCVTDMKNFYKALSKYKKNPSSFTGKPELPGYKRKGGRCTCSFSNEVASVRKDKDSGEYRLHLPKTKLSLEIGYIPDNLSFMEAKLTPDNGEYVLSLVFKKLVMEDELPYTVPESPERVMSVDLGVDNLISATNNVGAPFVIYKGGFLKSANRFYNKRIAEIMSRQTTGTNRKFVSTPESQAITIKRNNSISDGMHKVAKHFVHLCVEHRIDTVVIGVNKGFKQEVNLGDVSNQNFVQIPFLMLRNMIQYLCEENGIRYIEREESYTSKANFLNRDYIPTYGKDDKDASFTGKRRPTKYKSDYVKKNGFRGLYKTDDNIIINSDLNGSANIMRKEFPELADAIKKEDFDNVIVIRHPDYDKQELNRKKQMESYSPSKAKLRRDKRKVS